MSKRFNIKNFWKPVSFNQFGDTALNLRSSLERINPNISSRLLLTIDKCDYDGWGSLTIITPETDLARKRRRECALEDLNEDLWNMSHKVGLYIKNPAIETPYMVSLSVEERDPKSMHFYAQCLDDNSQAVFDSFRKTKTFQRLGDDYLKPSGFAASHALASCMRRR